jgi:hypothetical protein
MRRWAVLCLLLVANYFFMLVRHEGCHALVAVAAGSEIVDFHVWPPRGLNLSWITAFSATPRSLASLRLEAAAPYLVSLLLLCGSLWYLAEPRRPGFLKSNLVLTGVVFAVADLALGVAGYWVADNDLSFVFGSGTTASRLFASVWVVALAGISGLILFHPAKRRLEGRLAGSS